MRGLKHWENNQNIDTYSNYFDPKITTIFCSIAQKTITKNHKYHMTIYSN